MVQRAGLLKGIRILDLTWLVAGPAGTLLLAMAGADVIRIESRRSLDNFRRSFIQDNDPDKSYLFATINMGKRSVLADLKTPTGLKTVRRLAAASDVVVENFSPGTAGRLGLGYEDLIALNPSLVVVSASTAGQAGPKSQYAGYAPNFAALGGLASLTGYANGLPAIYGRTLDGRIGVHIALAVVIGLLRRERHGVGGYYDVSDQETVASLIGDVLVEVDGFHRNQVRDGNTQAGIAGHGCYPCLGHDRWLMLELEGDQDWEKLCRAIDREDLFQDPRFADGYLRWQHRDIVDAAISAWTGSRDNKEGAWLLQAAGLRATAVADAADLYHDPALRERKMWQVQEHPALGLLTVLGAPLHWPEALTSDEPLSPAPLLGQHTDEVLSTVLGLSASEIEGLRQAGALA